MEITKENIKELVGRRFVPNKEKYPLGDWIGTLLDLTNDTFTIHYSNKENTLYASVEAIIDSFNDNDWLLLPTEPTSTHYDNTNGSLYLFAEQHGLNSYESDILKRIVRCRKKGEFLSDIDKMIEVLNLYLKEQGHKYEGQIEKLNK